jgi:AcrR family transcriptional regulator
MIDKSTKKDATHKAILESATELLSLKPTSTLQEIADYSRVGIATLHRHFASREALLDELAMNAVQLVNEALVSVSFDDYDARGSLNNLFSLLIPLGNKISFLGTSTYTHSNPQVIQEEERLQQLILNAIKKWQQTGQLRNDMPAKWIMVVLYDLLFISWQEIQIGNIARNDAAGYLLNTTLNGFGRKERNKDE